MKLIPITCSQDQMQVLHEVISSHIAQYFPPGSADSSLVAREALLEVIQHLTIAMEDSVEGFMFNKRLRAFCTLAIENAQAAGQFDEQTAAIYIQLFKAKK
ncbi:MAG: hypothetical protein HOM11_14250 [Methylococcales bacterium]|jgi:hypothetical protein|nr:hypothetical protein [Methylococcales bacterium]MBT7442856.1 hypothetical protein [Methylococcales bacterium]